MSILSFEFILFLGILLLLYYLLPAKWQWIVLLCANLYFFATYGVGYLIFPVITAATAWKAACLLEQTNEKFKRLRAECKTKEEKQANKQACTRQKKTIMTIVLIGNLGLWIIMKYGFRMPALGMSFYTLIAMGYCVDVYRGKFAPEKSFWRFLLFQTFFPQLVQGPFSRYDKLNGMLTEQKTFSFENMEKGMIRILWGFFKKMVVADRLSVVSSAIYAGEVTGGIYVPVLMAVVTLQLYADFSGYMDIVCGVSRMLGIRLQENFRQPFFARSIEEVWRRWHITLGEWFRDYVFYPVSMSKWAQNLGKRCKEKLGAQTARMIPSYLALAAVWTSTGLWHGLAPQYLVWGWMNLVIIVGSMLLAPIYARMRNALHISAESRKFQIFQRLRTFLLFGLMEMISDAPSLSGAVRIGASFFTVSNWGLVKHPLLLLPGLDVPGLIIVMGGLLVMLAVDWILEHADRTGGIGAIWNRVPAFGRSLGYAAVFYAIILFGNMGADAAGGFMYAQF